MEGYKYLDGRLQKLKGKATKTWVDNCRDLCGSWLASDEARSIAAFSLASPLPSNPYRLNRSTNEY